MTTYEGIIQTYKKAREGESAVINELYKKHDKLEAAVCRYHRIAEQKEKERKKIWQKMKNIHKTYWTEGIVKPLMDEVSRITGLPFNTSDLCTFGLGCECPVSAKDENGEYLAWITFVPSFVDDYKINMYTGKKCNRYEEGTIGAINGGNNVEEPVTGIESVLTNLRRRFPELNIT